MVRWWWGGGEVVVRGWWGGGEVGAMLHSKRDARLVSCYSTGSIAGDWSCYCCFITSVSIFAFIPVYFNKCMTGHRPLKIALHSINTTEHTFSKLARAARNAGYALRVCSFIACTKCHTHRSISSNSYVHKRPSTCNILTVNCNTSTVIYHLLGV